MLVRYEQFSVMIARIYRYIARIEDAEMKKLGLKGQFAFLIAALNKYPEGITAAKLTVICETDKAAVSRMIKELEENGIVTKATVDGKNYRSLIRLTDKGLEVAEYVNSRVHDVVSRAADGLSEEQRTALYQAFDIIAGNLKNICKTEID